jgi:uncharacterized membrane protein YgcG
MSRSTPFGSGQLHRRGLRPRTLSVAGIAAVAALAALSPASALAGGNTTTTLSDDAGDSLVTNQTVTITATVTQDTGSPAGTVAFTNNFTPITGCGAQPVNPVTGGGFAAVCPWAVSPADSDEQLGASFTPDPVADPGAAPSDTLNKVQVDLPMVAVQPTTTTISASATSAVEGAEFTLTATVAPTTFAAPLKPTGNVSFLYGAFAIPCNNGGSALDPSTLMVSCTTSFPDTGDTDWSTTYNGDSNFATSTSDAVHVTIVAPQPSNNTSNGGSGVSLPGGGSISGGGTSGGGTTGGGAGGGKAGSGTKAPGASGGKKAHGKKHGKKKHAKKHGKKKHAKKHGKP